MRPRIRRLERRTLLVVVVSCGIVWFYTRLLRPTPGDATALLAVLGLSAVTWVAVLRWYGRYFEG